MKMTTTPHQAPPVSEGLRFLLEQDHGDLFALIDEITVDGGKKNLGIKETVEQVRHEQKLSGFRFIASGWIQGHILLGLLPAGGFVIRTALATNGAVTEKSHYYNESGVLLCTQIGDDPLLIPLDALEMDLDCPFIDQLYNFLAVEYNHAKNGSTKTSQIYRVERFFRTRGGKRSLVSSLQRRKDPLIRHVFQKMLTVEADPVLNWEERQVVYNNILSNLSRILKVKQRASGIGPITQTLIMLRFRWVSFLKRVKTRPINNLMGILYSLTIQKFIWFFQTVKANLGLSVAMAVYGPFTYFFITMPMNPYAMNVVNKVQAVYLDTKHDFIKSVNNDEPSTQAVSTISDSVTTGAAAPVNSQSSKLIPLPTNPNVILDSSITSGRINYPLIIDDKKIQGIPTYLNFLISTDVPSVNMVEWSERMVHFKQVQAAYESNLEASYRIGRLEQLETQYNFPMMVESAWEEMERYTTNIFRLRNRNKNLSPKLKQYLTNEVNRTQQLELYLWDRLARFILDQRYVMLDQDQEQKRNDYYIGRAFVFMEEMTKTLSWRYPEFKRPYGYEKIAKLAEKYNNGRKETGNVLQNLAANSNLFKQKDLYSTKEFRSYMGRQWEILYLQNLKVQEAANNGLNMYIWSVRNTVWCLQSIYSAKRSELDLLIQKDLDGQLDAQGKVDIAKVDMLYETLFHNLTLEWVGVKEEIGSKLAKDIETVQRKVVIDNLKEFLSDRTKLFIQPATTAKAL